MSDETEEPNFQYERSVPRRLRPLKTNRARNKRWVIAASVIVFGATAVSIAFFSQQSDPTVELPQNISSQADFPLYTPATMPKNYRLKEDSITFQDNVLFYSLTNDESSILITVQALPQTNLDLEITDGLKPLNTSLGTAFTGKQESNPVAILKTDQSLIIATADSDVAASALESIISSLKPSLD